MALPQQPARQEPNLSRITWVKGGMGFSGRRLLLEEAIYTYFHFGRKTTDLQCKVPFCLRDACELPSLLSGGPAAGACALAAAGELEVPTLQGWGTSPGQEQLGIVHIPIEDQIPRNARKMCSKLG